MFGDIVLFIKKVFKQQTCIHDYKVVNRFDTGGSMSVVKNVKN